MDAERAKRVMEELEKLYPEAKPELNFRNPYETLNMAEKCPIPAKL